MYGFPGVWRMLGHLVSNYQAVPPAAAAAGTLGLGTWLRRLLAVLKR